MKDDIDNIVLKLADVEYLNEKYTELEALEKVLAKDIDSYNCRSSRLPTTSELINSILENLPENMPKLEKLKTLEKGLEELAREKEEDTPLTTNFEPNLCAEQEIPNKSKFSRKEPWKNWEKINKGNATISGPNEIEIAIANRHRAEAELYENDGQKFDLWEVTNVRIEIKAGTIYVFSLIVGDEMTGI